MREITAEPLKPPPGFIALETFDRSAYADPNQVLMVRGDLIHSYTPAQPGGMHGGSLIVNIERRGDSMQVIYATNHSMKSLGEAIALCEVQRANPPRMVTMEDLRRMDAIPPGSDPSTW